VFQNIPTVTKNLLIINVLAYLASVVLEMGGTFDLSYWGGLHFFGSPHFYLYQFVTYMFLHGSLTHLFFNMFSLWMFGSLLERVFGSKRFLFYYISCGLGAALVQELVWQFSWQSILASSVSGPAAGSVTDIIKAINEGHAAFTMNDFYNSLITIGASGAVFGILLAFGMLFPNMPMYIIPFPFPIKAKWMVLGYGLIELFFGVSHTMNGVAHFAHLGGMIAGIIITLYWRHNGTLTRNGLY
jgi:membrane associated rhomboid family serine protease